MDRTDAGNYDVLVAQEAMSDGAIAWTAVHPELFGCNATGASREEALANLAQARKVWLEVAAANGYEIPEPHQDASIATEFLTDPASPRMESANIEAQVVVAAA
jgi:predicted RNase H-like HicB family nuclease